MRHVYRRFISVLLLICMLSSLWLLPTSAEGEDILAPSVDPAVRFEVIQEGETVTLSMQVKGTDLCRTLCAALYYDASDLSVRGAVYTTNGEMQSERLYPMRSDDIVYSDGWACGYLSAYGGIKDVNSADLGCGGYLILYPYRDAPVTYEDFTTVVTVPFTVKQFGALSEDTIRLLTAEEQATLLITTKLLLCDPYENYTYGATAGGDRLSDALFVGNTVISGHRAVEDQPPQTPWVNPYTDITNNAPYYDAVAYVSREGLFIGSDGKFSPEASMMRSTFATVLCRLAGAEEVALAADAAEDAEPLPFTDLDPEGWYIPYIRWAVGEGLFLGIGDNKFSPDGIISHEQMYALMQRFCLRYGYACSDGQSVSVKSLADGEELIASAGWVQSAVRFAYANGLLILDKAGTVRPKVDAARWELAALLEALSELPRTAAPADEADPTDEAVPTDEAGIADDTGAVSREP